MLVENQIDISSYIGLVRSAALASGIIFELPIIIYFLTKIGLVTPQFLKKYRKYALVIVLILICNYYTSRYCESNYCSYSSTNIISSKYIHIKNCS